MADIMRPVPFSGLLERIAGEYREHSSIFSVNSSEFFSDDFGKTIKVFSQSCTNPIGPAAGPHTQLSQNIITSYLTGARFIELKTVQIMDHLDIAKPCIDASDEGFNVEWSTEFTLEKAYDEYLKAWIILHILEAGMKKREVEVPSFIFNMSVGYDLKGIQTEKMQNYIDSMIDARKSDKFNLYRAEAIDLIEGGLFEGTEFDDYSEEIIASIKQISANISPSVTVSTMHGCPPKEIEAICSYLLKEKGLDTFVKLNPTLLGYDEVRRILDSIGFDYVQLSREAFEKDLHLDDAISMLHRLSKLASELGRGFGVKLTNTLGNDNTGNVLPGNERYMSGRPLLPISTKVALILSKEFGGRLPISYSGGASALSIENLFNTGIHPITLATDILKPGGYTRLKQMSSIIKDKTGWSSDVIDIAKLEELNKELSEIDGIASKEKRGSYKAKVGDELGLFDCYVAPCVEACPINQPIPDYVALAGSGRYSEALGLIYMTNALPNITGWICDHQCQNHCTRLDYEGPVKIREVKRRLAESAFGDYLKDIWPGKDEPTDTKAAVIGAGPAGLAAAYFLAVSGFDTHVFEREKNAGGVVANIIPQFRIPSDPILRDISFIEMNGAQFHYDSNITVSALREQGFKYIFVAIGAEKSRDPKLSGNGNIISATKLLLSLKRGDDVKLGRHVVVIGGGNTAMDAARAAIRQRDVKDVTVVYRRSKDEMPADKEEYELALKDGIKFNFLSLPTSTQDGILTVEKMALGNVDKSGRRKPVATGETFELPCTYVISAIGEEVDKSVLKALSYDDEDENIFLIGDASSGPSTVVKCIASARSAVDTAIESVYAELEATEDDEEDDECGCGHHHDEGEDCSCGHEHHHDEECGCGHHHEDEEEEEYDEEEMRSAENEYFEAIREKKARILDSNTTLSNKEFFEREAARCLECSYLCNKCTEVCPNRANVAIDLRGYHIFEDPFQILHLDAYCNECGNCETFCPHKGGPYKKKFTLFSRDDDFKNSTNSGFYTDGKNIKIRLDGKIINAYISKENDVIGNDLTDEVRSMIEEVFLSYSYLLGEVEE